MKDQDFKPTSAMKLYAFQKAKNGNLSKDSAISKTIGIRAETISRWKQINGFSEWLEDAVAKYQAPLAAILEQVALDNINDFRFWEALATKIGYNAPVAAQNHVVQLRYSLCECEREQVKQIRGQNSKTVPSLNCEST